MANDKNKHDWLIANLKSPSNTFGDFSQEGLTGNNTQLLSRSDYEKSDLIQSSFVDEKGEFDSDTFNKFYDHASQTYNVFVQDDFDKTILNGDYFSEDNIYAPINAKRIRNSFSISKQKNPFGNVAGTTLMKTRTPSDLTLREIAQTQKIFDPKTGKYEEQTPNDLGFWGSLFNKDTLVISQYDEDGEHYDEDLGRVITHRKGDLRFNSEGKPVYERLGNREIYGRTPLSPFDVLTVDGSWANRYDFMDSDSREKSLFGTAMKTTATILPYVVPYVRNVWTALTLSNALATDLIPAISKSSAGLLFGDSVKNSDYFKTMNQLQNIGGRFRNSVSDEAQESLFNTENLFGLVSDVFAQIAQQRYIAQIPGWLGSTRSEAEVLARASKHRSPADMAELRNKLNSLQGMDFNTVRQRNNLLRTELSAGRLANDNEIIDILNKWDRWSSSTGRALGVTYMAGIASTGILEEAKMNGLDERDTAALFFGTFASLGALMGKADFMSWTLKGLGLDDVTKHLNKTMRESLKDALPKLQKSQQALSGKLAGDVLTEGAEDAAKIATKSAWYKSLFETGRNITTKSFDKVSKIIDDDFALIQRAVVGESMEETSEELVADAIKTIYNGAMTLGLTSTSSESAKPFDVFDEALSRYAMAAFGGAIGGGIVGFQDKIGGRLHNSLPESLKAELSSIVLHGYADQFEAQLEKQWKKGLLAPTTLSGVPSNLDYKLTNDITYDSSNTPNSVSQNDMAYNLIKSEIDFLKKAIYQEGDVTDFNMAPIYQYREAELLDLKHTTSIRDDIAYVADQIIDLQAQIDSIEGGIKDATQKETTDNQAKIAVLNARMRPLREELEQILSGERLPYYVQHALFDTNPIINKAYGVKDKNDYAEHIYSKPYDLLNNEQKTEVDDGYAEYVKFERRQASKVGFQRFLQDQETFIKHHEKLKIASKQRAALLDNGLIDTIDVDIKLDNNESKLENLTTSHFKLLKALESIRDTGDATSIDLSSTETDSPSILNGENIFQSYLNLVKSQDYIDPELTSFLKRNLKMKLNSVLSVNDDIVNDSVKIFVDIVNALANKKGINQYDISDAVHFISNNFLEQNGNRMNALDITDLIEDLRNEAFLKKSVFDTFEDWAVNNLDEEFDYGVGKLYEHDDAEYKQQRISEFRTLLNEAIPLFESAFFEGVIINGNDISIAESTPESIYSREIVDISNELKNELDSKTMSPFHEMLTEFANIEGVPEINELFDTISNQYGDLMRLGADQFIINNRLDQQHLQYAKNVIDRLKALMLAATEWDSADLAEEKLIGFNSAVNKLAANSEDYQELPVITVGDVNTLYNHLNTLDSRIDMLLTLSDANVNGTVRESKVLGARALSLYLESIAPDSANYDLLKSLNLDTTGLDIAFEQATQYQENIKSIRSSTEDAPIPFPSSDENLNRLRIEKDVIEQELYKIFNDNPNRVDALRKAIASISTENVDFGLNTVFNRELNELGRLQEIIYFFQTATIDPKQFYKDFGGVISADTNELTESEIVPFLNQEIVLKQVYFSIISKYKKDIDVYSELLNKVYPERDAAQENRKYNNREDLLNLHNAIFLDGIPGAGKTTVVANFLSKMVAKYGLNVATYAPFKEQIDNLNGSMSFKENLINPEGSITDELLQSILGEELFTQIHNELTQGIDVNNQSDDNAIRFNYDEINQRHDELGDSFTGYFMDRLNTKNPKVSEFMNNFSKITINGTTPNVIVIDESTLIHSSLLEALNFAVDAHNKNPKNKEKVSLVMIGDTEQNGAQSTYRIENNSYESISNIAFVNHFSTPKLNQSFRSFYSTLNDNISILRAFRANSRISILRKDEPSTINRLISLKYKYTEQDGLIGFKDVLEYTESEIDAIFKHSGETIVPIITDKADSSVLAIIKSMGIDEGRYRVFSPTNVQGLEADYVIIDLSTTPNYLFNIENISIFDKDVNRLYTSLSRAKKGALINSDASNIIKIDSNSEGVSPYKIELNKDNLARFKDFTINSIKQSFNGLDDLEQNSAEEVVVTPTPITKDDMAVVASELTDIAINNAKTVEPVKGIAYNSVDSSGNVLENTGNTLGDRALSYTYHEHTGLGLSFPSGKVLSEDHIENTDSDVNLLGRLLNYGEKPSLSDLNDKLDFLRNQLKILKTAIPAWYQNSNDTDLTDYLIESGMSPEIMNGLQDIEDWDVGVLVKTFDVRFDTANSHIFTGNWSGGNTDIAYVVLYDPSSFDGKRYTKYITLAATPNAKNDNVPAEIKNSLYKLYANFKKVKDELGTDKVIYKFNDSLSKGDILSPVSNLIYKSRAELNKSKRISYADFIKMYSHFNISAPFIIANDLFPSVLTDNNIEDVDNAISEMSLPLDSSTTSKVRLTGIPAVVISTNKSVSNNTDRMVARLRNQIKTAQESNSFIPGDTRLMILQTKGRSFSEWFKWNSELVKESRKDGNDTDIFKKELAAAENNYAAAKILSRLTWMLNNYYDQKSKVIGNGTINYKSFLPESLLKSAEISNSTSINEVVDNFMSKVQTLMNYAIPATIGMSYIDYIGSITQFSISNEKDSVIAFDALQKRESSEIRRLQNKYYADAAYSQSPEIEHLITRRLLNFIESNRENINIEMTDENSQPIPISKSDKMSMKNMVSAIRIAIDGGKIKMKNGDLEIFQQGVIFNESYNKDAFLKQLDHVLTGEVTALYKPLFPGGIHSNVVYRRRTDENKFTSALPFNMDVGVNHSEFEIDVDVQIPRIAVDLNALNQQHEFSVVNKGQEKELKQNEEVEIQKIFDDLRQELNTFVANNKFRLENVREYNEFLRETLDLYINNVNTVEEARRAVESILEDVTANNDFLTKNLTKVSNSLNGNVEVNINELVLNNYVDTSNFTVFYNDAGEIATRYLENNDITNMVRSQSPRANTLLEQGGEIVLTSSDGVTINYYIKTEEVMEKFGTFVTNPDIVEDGNGNFIPVFTGEFELLRGETAVRDLTNWTNFKTNMETLYSRDNPEKWAVIDDFIRMLDEAVNNNFINMNTPEAVKFMSTAYLNASIALKDDPEALTAFRKFYADFTKTNTC